MMFRPLILLALAGQAAEPVPEPRSASTGTIPIYACISIPPVLLSGKRTTHPAVEDAAARCVWATWSGAGELLVVAVSVSDHEEDVRIPLPAGTLGTPSAVFGHRPGLLRVEGGELRGTLPSGAVRVLRLRP